MKNREKHAKEIMDVACQGERFTVDKNGNVGRCGAIHCFECIFKIDNSCKRAEFISEWCEAEYVEKPKISENDRRFLDYLPSEDAWIARDESGCLYLYCENKPRKGYSDWYNSTDRYMQLNKLINIDFPMIKWEDAEPWLIEDLKKLEVRDD